MFPILDLARSSGNKRWAREIIDTSKVWYPPAGVLDVIVYLQGGGQGGMGGGAAYNGSGSPGLFVAANVHLRSSNPISITVAGPGAAGWQVGYPGVQGGATSFGGYATAYGGYYEALVLAGDYNLGYMPVPAQFGSGYNDMVSMTGYGCGGPTDRSGGPGLCIIDYLVNQ